MNFLRSRAEQVAEHLRADISQKRLVDPLPNVRAWSRQLSVSRSTLEAALRLLQREGLVRIGPRGVAVNRLDMTGSSGKAPDRFVVRLISFTRHQSAYYWPPWVDVYSDRLPVHGIEVRHELCSTEKLEAMVREKKRDGELLLLFTLPPRFQEAFARSRKPALVVGQANENVSLPFVCLDQDGAVRHATQELLRRGFRVLNLVIEKIQTPGIRRAAAAFREVCSEWNDKPVHGHVVQVPIDPDPMLDSVRRLAARIRGRQGIVTLPPIAVGTIMTALLQQGVAVPAQVELAAVFPTPESVLVFPRPTYYPFPTNRLVKVLTETAMHFFATGILPSKGRVIPVEVIRPSETSGTFSST